ncbi:hypothetical protein DFJ73DRAFT_828995 [Zopfochytrium polystomum]|nr:hypothetical protein DFJ73DRAFT_828995 [Zopfochytrium polystomum]
MYAQLKQDIQSVLSRANDRISEGEAEVARLLAENERLKADADRRATQVLGLQASLAAITRNDQHQPLHQQQPLQLQSLLESAPQTALSAVAPINGTLASTSSQPSSPLTAALPQTLPQQPNHRSNPPFTASTPQHIRSVTSAPISTEPGLTPWADLLRRRWPALDTSLPDVEAAAVGFAFQHMLSMTAQVWKTERRVTLAIPARLHGEFLEEIKRKVGHLSPISSALTPQPPPPTVLPSMAEAESSITSVSITPVTAPASIAAPSVPEPAHVARDPVLVWTDVLRKRWPLLSKEASNHTMKHVMNVLRDLAKQFGRQHHVQTEGVFIKIPESLQGAFIDFVSKKVGTWLDAKLSRATTLSSGSLSNSNVRIGANATYWTNVMRTRWPLFDSQTNVAAKARGIMSRYVAGEQSASSHGLPKELWGSFLDFMTKEMGSQLDEAFGHQAAPQKRLHEGGPASDPKRSKTSTATDGQDTSAADIVIPWTTLIRQRWPAYSPKLIPTVDHRLTPWIIEFCKEYKLMQSDSSGSMSVPAGLPGRLQNAFLTEADSFFGAMMASHFPIPADGSAVQPPDSVGDAGLNGKTTGGPPPVMERVHPGDGEEVVAWTDLVRRRWPAFSASTSHYHFIQRFGIKHSLSSRVQSSVGHKAIGVPKRLQEEFIREFEALYTPAVAHSRNSTNESLEPIIAWTDVIRRRWPGFKSNTNFSLFINKFAQTHGLVGRAMSSMGRKPTIGVPQRLHDLLISEFEKKWSTHLNGLTNQKGSSSSTPQRLSASQTSTPGASAAVSYSSANVLAAAGRTGAAPAVASVQRPITSTQMGAHGPPPATPTLLQAAFVAAALSNPSQLRQDSMPTATSSKIEPPPATSIPSPVAIDESKAAIDIETVSNGDDDDLFFSGDEDDDLPSFVIEFPAIAEVLEDSPSPPSSLPATLDPGSDQRKRVAAPMPTPPA